MAYILNRRLLENAFEIASLNVSAARKDLAEPSLKNKRLSTVKLAWVNKTSERNSKVVQEKIYTSTDKVWNVVSLAARNSMDEYTETKKSSL